MANLELTDSIIGVLGKNETEKTVAQILTILESRGDIEGSGLRSEVTISGFNFGESNTVSVGTTEETKTAILTANFTSPAIDGAYYVLIEGKKYPISKTNGRIKIERTAIETNDNASAKISNVSSTDTNIAEVSKTGDKQITIIGKARGNTTITVQSTGLPDVTLNVNVKGSTALTINTDNTANCSVSPTSVTALEGEEVQLTATPASGKKLKGWYVGNSQTAISTANPYKYKIPDGTTYATSITITAQFEERTSEIEEGRNPERYGGYVRYNIDLGIDGNFDGVDDGIDDDWRIFYEDSQNVYLIAASYVPVSNTYLSTAMENMGAVSPGSGYEYSVYWPESSFLTSHGGNSFTSAVGAPDIFTNRPIGTEKLDGKGFLSFWKEEGGATSSQENAKITACLMDTKVWEGFAGGIPSNIVEKLPKNDNKAYAIGGPTMSLFVESWNTMNPNPSERLYYCANSNGYYINAYTPPYKSRYYCDESISTTNQLYFPYSNFLSKCAGYWLASPLGQNDVQCHRTHFSNGISLTTRSEDWNGIRPVVCLPSSVQLTETAEGSNLYTISNKTTTE